MKSIPVRVLLQFTHKKQTYRMGEIRELPIVDAIQLMRKRQVIAVKKGTVEVPPPEAEAPIVAPDASKRKYKRRDLQAEDLTATVFVPQNHGLVDPIESDLVTPVNPSTIDDTES